MENTILVLLIIIPIMIALYIYALIRFKESINGIGLIGFNIEKENKEIRFFR